MTFFLVMMTVFVGNAAFYFIGFSRGWDRCEFTHDFDRCPHCNEFLDPEDSDA